MNSAFQTGSVDGDRIFAPRLLFLPFSTFILPPFRVRFVLALVLSFFPLGVFYPLDYPVRELITLSSWVWVFPSPVSCLAVVLIPLMLSESYGYFAFNLFCFSVMIGIAFSASRSRDLKTEATGDSLYKAVRCCALLTISICILQALSGPSFWTSLFPHMHLGDDAGRGAGLVSEPSLLAGPLVLYLTLLASRIRWLRAAAPGSSEERSTLREGMIVMLCFVLLSRSISVAIAAAAFLPVVFLRRRNWISSALSAGIGLIVAILVLGSRIREAAIDAQGGILAFMTVALNSWRNIPDILILANYKAFLLPTHPADLRSKITEFAFDLDPALSWIQNTYSMFAASASTVGLIAVSCVFAFGLIIGFRFTSRAAALRFSWFLLYIYDWFLSPKFDAAGWIALGALPLVWRMAREEIQ